MPDIQWFDSKEADVAMKELVIDSLYKCFVATFEELIKENGAVEVLSAMKPHMKVVYRDYFNETIRAMKITGNEADSLLTVFNIAQVFAVPTNKMDSKITEFGGVGKVYQCPFQNSIPEMCIYMSHNASEEVCQLMNPEYECIFTHHLTAGDPYCQCIFKKKNQPLKDPEDLGKTIVNFPELKIPEQQLLAMRLGGITLQWNGVTSAFVQMNGAERAKEILYPKTKKIGQELGNKIKEKMPNAGENAESLGKLVQSLAQVLNQMYKPALASIDKFVVEVTDCACQTLTPEFCGQYGALVNGILSSLNPDYEFVYDRMMTRGDKGCQWTIKSRVPTVQKDSPLHILKVRFAKGEISKEEYIEMKALLEG